MSFHNYGRNCAVNMAINYANHFWAKREQKNSNEKVKRSIKIERTRNMQCKTMHTEQARTAKHAGKKWLGRNSQNSAGILKAGFHWRRSWSRSRSRSRKSASDLVKIENRSRKRSHKLDRIGVGRIRTVPFSSDSAYDSDAYGPVKTKLSESRAEAAEPTNYNAGFILWLLLTPTI